MLLRVPFREASSVEDDGRLLSRGGERGAQTERLPPFRVFVLLLDLFLLLLDLFFLLLDLFLLISHVALAFLYCGQSCGQHGTIFFPALQYIQLFSKDL